MEVDFDRLSRDQDAWNEITKGLGGIPLSSVDRIEKYLVGGLIKFKFITLL